MADVTQDGPVSEPTQLIWGGCHCRWGFSDEKAARHSEEYRLLYELRVQPVAGQEIKHHRDYVETNLKYYIQSIPNGKMENCVSSFPTSYGKTSSECPSEKENEFVGQCMWEWI